MINWPVLSALILAKFIIFCIGAMSTLALDRSKEGIAKAGIRGIFVTQSNDIAYVIVCTCPLGPAEPPVGPAARPH